MFCSLGSNQGWKVWPIRFQNNRYVPSACHTPCCVFCGYRVQVFSSDLWSMNINEFLLSFHWLCSMSHRKYKLNEDNMSLWESPLSQTAKRKAFPANSFNIQPSAWWGVDQYFNQSITLHTGFFHLNFFLQYNIVVFELLFSCWIINNYEREHCSIITDTDIMDIG